ncbi:GyrI-like domain-containing protein [Salinibacterium sp. SYSU T00001]|uniref:GyrI-like domain-containing protein n=1 Tax=Homoserinimonas sedimenticola TaxID=2986805 RepID=UPI0022369D55|nr:GyrI-like domain-containing protein [Salinibacterium sedimenticola]MCW4386594.1 GyrI-like domain-containing protein [Salinibacterium sedimenticola]
MSDTSPAASAAEIIALNPMTVAVRRETIQMANIRDYFDDVYGAVMAVLSEQGVAPAGPALAVYHGQPGETVDVAAGFPTNTPIETVGSIAALELPGGLAAQYTHRGSYDGLAEAYQRFVGWIYEQGHTPGQLFWEVYVTEPTPDADPDDMVTHIVWPLAEQQ